jgi:hypothetical protein
MISSRLVIVRFEWFGSFAPPGLVDLFLATPTACAVGCILSPLRGCAGGFLESFSVPRDSKVLRRGCLYSNVPEIALGWITLVSFEESNPKAGKRGPVSNAAVDTMVDMAVPVPDVVDGGGGVYP